MAQKVRVSVLFCLVIRLERTVLSNTAIVKHTFVMISRVEQGRNDIQWSQGYQAFWVSMSGIFSRDVHSHIILVIAIETY